MPSQPRPASRPPWLLGMLAGFAFEAVPARAEDAQLWTAAEAALPLAPDTMLRIEAQLRFGDAEGGLYESIFGFWISEDIGGAELAVGYQHNRSQGRPDPTREHRIRQQIRLPVARLGRGRLEARLRAEQRFRNDGADVQIRARPEIRYSHPLGRKLEWSLSHESFFATAADWNDQRGWFRMRNQAMIAIPLTQRIMIETGYLNQYARGRNGAPASVDHVALLGLSLDF